MRVALLDDYQDVARGAAPWDELDGVSLVRFERHIADDDELVAALADCDAAIAIRERTPFTRTRLERLPKLRLLVTAGMKNAAIDLEAARELGVTVCGTRSNVLSTVELTWALVLAVTRRVCAEDRALRAGGWQHTIGPELNGRTLGIVGLGTIGERSAAVARAFGMDVVAWSQNLTEERARECGAVAVSKEELLERADVVVLHTRLSERTVGLIGAAELAAMRPTAYLVNTSRGPIVDERALLVALHDGSIAGAGLDVYDLEPLPPDHPLRSAPNTVLTPHLGYVALRNYEWYYGDALEDIRAFRRRQPIRVLNG